MNAGEICNREIVFVHRDTAVPEAAKLMDDYHVGSLVVVERGAARLPVGMLTDRDLTLAVIARRRDLSGLTVGDVMGAGLVTVREGDSVTEVLRLMRERGVRRVPVLGPGGSLAGLVTLDDVLDIIAEELGELVHAIARERSREERSRRQPLPPRES